MNVNYEAERLAKILDAQTIQNDTMPTVVTVDEHGMITVEEVKRPLNGRRLLRKEIQARFRLVVVDPNDSSRFVKMGSRKQRRAPLPNVKDAPRRIGKAFRPVLAHAIPVKGDHKSIIRALKVKDRRIAKRYLESKQPLVKEEELDHVEL